MSISIAVCSGKGGTGKTVISANLGVALAQLGKDVTIIDSDLEMANLAHILGIEKVGRTLNDVMAGDAEISEAIYDGPEGVKVLPAGVSLESLKKAEYENMNAILEKLRGADILIIDAPAGLNKSVLTAISSAQEVLLVVTPDVSSMTDALKTKILANRLGAHVLGAVLNRTTFDSSDLTVREVGSLLETSILAVVPEDLEVKKTCAYGVPVIVRKPSSPAAVEIKKFAARLIGEEYKPPGEEKTPFFKKLGAGLFGR